MEQEVKLKPTIRGLEIFRGAETAPRVVSMPSSGCVLDVAVLKAIKVEDPELINFGLQAQYLTGERDTLVVRSAPKVDRVRAARLVNSGMEIVAELWERQTGVRLSAPREDDSHIRLVPPDRVMAEFAAASMDLAQNRFVAVAPYPQIVRGLGIGEGDLVQVSQAHELLASKNSAMRILSDLGIPVPATVSFDRTFEVSQLQPEKLDPRKRYLIKPDGGVGGFGIRSNNGQGYDLPGVFSEVSAMAQSGTLPERFQVQEFIKGQSLGAVAIFDGVGNARITSVHSMVEKNGMFVGVDWNRDLDKALRPEVTRLFQKLAQAKDYPLRGPVGFDLQYDGKNLSVIEVNPRITGASPVGVLLSEQKTIAERKGPSNFRIDSVYIDIAVKIPEKRFEDPRDLQRVFEGVVARALECSDDPSRRPMVLPQGLSPFDASKVVFVNDPNGQARMDLIQQLGLGD